MSSYENPSIADALLIALVGFATVFVVLIVLMGIIVLISRIFGENEIDGIGQYHLTLLAAFQY